MLCFGRSGNGDWERKKKISSIQFPCCSEKSEMRSTLSFSSLWELCCTVSFLKYKSVYIATAMELVSIGLSWLLPCTYCLYVWVCIDSRLEAIKIKNQLEHFRRNFEWASCSAWKTLSSVLWVVARAFLGSCKGVPGTNKTSTTSVFVCLVRIKL